MKKAIVLLVIGLIFALAAFIVYYRKREVVQVAPIVETRPEGYFVQISPGGAWDVEKWISPNEMVFTAGGQPYKLRIGDEEFEATKGINWDVQVYTSRSRLPSSYTAHQTLTMPRRRLQIPHKVLRASQHN